MTRLEYPWHPNHAGSVPTQTERYEMRNPHARNPEPPLMPGGLRPDGKARKRLAQIAGAVALSFAMVFGMATNAYAYVSRSCTVYLTARLSATAWQTSSTNTRMHLDLNPYYGSSLTLNSWRILVDGIALKNSYGSYVVNDVYINRGANTSHSVQGQWLNQNGTLYACSVSIPSYPGY